MFNCHSSYNIVLGRKQQEVEIGHVLFILVIVKLHLSVRSFRERQFVKVIPDRRSIDAPATGLEAVLELGKIPVQGRS